MSWLIGFNLDRHQLGLAHPALNLQTPLQHAQRNPAILAKLALRQPAGFKLPDQFCKERQAKDNQCREKTRNDFGDVICCDSFWQQTVGPRCYNDHQRGRIKDWNEESTGAAE